MQLLALDFDGVISDSAPECFVVALETYVELHPGTRLEPDRERVRKAGDRVAEFVHNDALFREFVDRLPLGNRAEDFGVVLHCLDRSIPLPDQAAYDAFYASLERERLRAFHKRFYKVRAAWSERDPEGWLANMGPYRDFCALLRRRAGDVPLAIATAKDRRSVRKLLTAYGIADLFPDGFVLDKEAGVKKHMHVEQLAAKTGITPAEVTFVDDKVNHLEDVATLGARCVLAAWGYNGAREWKLAEAQGFLVCRIEDFEAKVF